MCRETRACQKKCSERHIAMAACRPLHPFSGAPPPNPCFLLEAKRKRKTISGMYRFITLQARTNQHCKVPLGITSRGTRVGK